MPARSEACSTVMAEMLPSASMSSQQDNRNKEQFIHLASGDKANVGQDEFSAKVATRLRKTENPIEVIIHLSAQQTLWRFRFRRGLHDRTKRRRLQAEAAEVSRLGC